MHIIYKTKLVQCLGRSGHGSFSPPASRTKFNLGLITSAQECAVGQ